MFRLDRIASFTPERKPFQICLMSTHKNSDVDFCNGAKLFLWFLKRSNRICSNFAIIEAIIAGTNSLKRFLKKTPDTEKHKNKIKM